jgi:hypothetical protein
VLHKNKKVKKRRQLERDARAGREKTPEMQKPRRVTPRNSVVKHERGRLFKGSKALKSRIERINLLVPSHGPTPREQRDLERGPAL